MYAGLQRKMASNVPFIPSFEFVIWPATIPWEIIPKGVAIGLKVIHFG
jgi:hypothetical protein